MFERAILIVFCEPTAIHLLAFTRAIAVVTIMVNGVILSRDVFAF
jgi:hypothetical protein